MGLKNLYNLARSIVVIPIRWRRKYGFRRFLKRRINLCKLDFNTAECDFDAFVFGSDQIWNPNFSGKVDNIYFGDFRAAKGKRLIAYAASAGSVNNILPYERSFFSLLSNYDAVSVRENTLKDFLKQSNRIKNVCLTLDPVLLAGRETFERVASQKNIRKNYVLVFQLGMGTVPALRKIADKIAKARNLKIIEAMSETEILRRPDVKTMLSPENFISLFQHASYVVTSSFHGMAFSILFEKDFYVYEKSYLSERMVNVLTELGLEERLINVDSELRLNTIDYNMVNKKLIQLRLQSQRFLVDALNVCTS